MHYGISKRHAHSLLQRKGCKATIPPRSNAGLWEDNHPRNEAVTALKEGKLAQWKQENGYHLRSVSETAMYRYKQLFCPKLSLRDYNAQVGEALAGVKPTNKVIPIGLKFKSI
ncbi:MAG: transposase [Paraglaciecola polaris]